MDIKPISFKFGENMYVRAAYVLFAKKVAKNSPYYLDCSSVWKRVCSMLVEFHHNFETRKSKFSSSNGLIKTLDISSLLTNG